MLAYAASRPLVGKRQSSPNAMLIVIGVHVAAIAALMSAKMDLPNPFLPDPTEVVFIPAPPPLSNPIERPRAPHPILTSIPQVPPRIPTPPTDKTPIDAGPVADPGPIAGGGAAVIPENPHQAATPVHRGPQLLTPPSQLKPSYPASKLLREEEATLILRLSIDENGRVVGVDPVGRADREFVEAARRHLMARWRYSPATQDGRAVASSLTVTLRFLLDG